MRSLSSAFAILGAALSFNSIAQPRPPPPTVPPGRTPPPIPHSATPTPANPSSPVGPTPGRDRLQVSPPGPGRDRVSPTPPATGAVGQKEKEISPSTGATQGARGAAANEHQQPSCEEIRKKARYNIYFDKVDIEKLVQTVSDATCKTFIMDDKIRGKISIIGPENGKVEVDADQFYGAFLAALDANNLTVYPYGKFLKIIEKNKAKGAPIPTIIDSQEPYTTNEQMVTRIFRVKYITPDELRGVITQLLSPQGDSVAIPGSDTLIINDLGSNMHRLDRIINQLDRRSSSDEVKVIQVHYASVQDLADKITKLFESKNPRARPGAPVTTPPPPGTPPGAPSLAAAGGAAGSLATLTQLIPDERTNKLIVIASPAAFDRINDLIRAIDVPTTGDGKISVYYLENANAEEVAATLQTLAQGTQGRPGAPGRPPTAPVPPGGQRPTPTSAELFSGEVKISADKATNALVIIANQSDYRNLSNIIQKLDIARRQVFVEAVIMEVNLDRNAEFGVGLHYGYTLKTDQGNLPVLFGTKYTKTPGLPPSTSLINLAQLGGFLAGLQGPAIPELANLGIALPQFGVILHALQQSSDVNVLSTPHVIATDNEEAEITVGQNVPFQAGIAAGSLSGLGSLGNLGSLGGLGTPATTTTTGVPGTTTPTVNPLLGLGGLGLGGFAPINRQNVELKLTVKPQINTESETVKLVLNEQTEEIASQDPVLGPTTSKRSAKTTVVAKDQETVVIGGIMQDRTIEGVSKIPILGDIPILGHLFRETTSKKVKTNLLLFLTPYIIRDHSDFRRIFERKLKERQQFVEQFYGEVPGYEVAVDFGRKPGPLAKMAQAMMKAEKKVENGGPGAPGEHLIRPLGGQPPPSAPAPGTPPPPTSPNLESAPNVSPEVPQKTENPATPSSPIVVEPPERPPGQSSNE